MIYCNHSLAAYTSNPRVEKPSPTMRELVINATSGFGACIADSIGVDAEDVARWRDPALRLDALFSESEIAHAEADADPPQVLAGTWCAKEAAFKAMAARGESVSLRDITIGREASGAPFATVRGERMTMCISISHTRSHAVAVALVVAEPRTGWMMESKDDD